jgi:ribosomal protein L37AE/L43A
MKEKLGVVVDPNLAEKAKVSSAGAKAHQPTCPGCHGPIQTRQGTNMPWCPRCGTRPFEKKEE